MKRPFVTLKVATTLDGRIATHSGQSQWITGDMARRVVHEMRGNHDAVLVGIETALKDDPELTVRLPGYEGFQPARVILDTNARLPLNSKLAQTARVLPTYLVSCVDAPDALKAAGIKALKVPSKHQKVDLLAALSALDDLGIDRLFVEGGGLVATSFLRAGAVDRIEWFRAPSILGGDGRSVFGFLNIDSLDHMPKFNRIHLQALGDDLWETYEALEQDAF